MTVTEDFLTITKLNLKNLNFFTRPPFHSAYSVDPMAATPQNQIKRRMKMNKVHRSEGRYNLLNPSEVSAQYFFQLRPDAPKELSRSYLINLDKDNVSSRSAYEVACELKDIIDSYWINTDQPKIKALVEYLELWSEKDEYDELKAERDKLSKRLAEVEKKLGGYDPEEWDNWTPLIKTNDQEAV